jgi:hypothetical protein
MDGAKLGEEAVFLAYSGEPVKIKPEEKSSYHHQDLPLTSCPIYISFRFGRFGLVLLQAFI